MSRRSSAFVPWSHRLKTGLLKNMDKKLIVTFGILSALTVQAENAVLLESFEANIGCATLVTNNGGRPLLFPPGVTLSQYARTDASDPHVTQGSKSLKVV